MAGHGDRIVVQRQGSPVLGSAVNKQFQNVAAYCKGSALEGVKAAYRIASNHSRASLSQKVAHLQYRAGIVSGHGARNRCAGGLVTINSQLRIGDGCGWCWRVLVRIHIPGSRPENVGGTVDVSYVDVGIVNQRLVICGVDGAACNAGLPVPDTANSVADMSVRFIGNAQTKL